MEVNLSQNGGHQSLEDLDMAPMGEERGNYVRSWLAESPELKEELNLVELGNGTGAEGLHKLERDIIAALHKYKSIYVDRMEGVLNQNPGWLTTEALRQKHDQLLEEAKKMFEAEITRKIRRELEVHVRSLHRDINGYWDRALETNNQNVRKKRDQDAKELEEIRKNEIKEMRERRASEKKILPPLAFQLQKTQIKMGMFLHGEPKILRNGYWKDSIPFIVGLNDGGNFIYGRKVLSGSSKPSSLRRYWWVGDHFLTSEEEPWSEEIRLGDRTRHKITVEFLLAFILKGLKEYVEADMNGLCSVCSISVPIWFCSSQRIQVKDGASLAGFSEVRLINEPSAAAYARDFSDAGLSIGDGILVISENGERIDASVYYYKGARFGSTLTMLGHHSSISDEGKKGLRGLAAAGASVMIGAVTGQSKNDPDGRLQIVRRACQKARGGALSCFSSDPNSKPHLALVTYESDEWGPILKQVGMEHALNLWGDDTGNAAILGATSLSIHHKFIYYKIRDHIGSSVRFSGGTVTHNCVFSKKHLLPGEFTAEAVAEFPGLCGKGEIYQSVAGHNVRVGAVELFGNFAELDEMFQAEATLQICNEGIVVLKQVTTGDTNPREDLHQRIPKDQIEWTTPNLSEGGKARLQKCLERLSTCVEKK